MKVRVIESCGRDPARLDVPTQPQTGGRPPGLLQTRSLNGVRCVSMRVAVGGTINHFTVGYTDASQEPAVLLNYSGDPVVIQCEKSTCSEVLACAYWTQQ